MLIDAHVHLLRAENFDEKLLLDNGIQPPKDTPLETLVSWLREAGVDKAVVMGQDMSRIWNSSCGEDYVLDAYNQYKDFFVPLASVEPIDGTNKLNRKALNWLEKAIEEYGFQGVLLTPPYGQYHSNDRQVYPFYELAQSKNVIVQFHHGAIGAPAVLCHLKYSNLLDLSDVIIDFPDLKIVVEHLAYPRTEQLFVLMANNTNIYADVSGLYSQPTLTAWRLVMAKEYKVIDRIMYASDYWSYSGDCSIMKAGIEYVREGVNWICKSSGWPTLDAEEIEGILWANANKLYELGLDESR